MKWCRMGRRKKCEAYSQNHTRQWAFALMCPLTPRLAPRFTVCDAFSVSGEKGGQQFESKDLKMRFENKSVIITGGGGKIAKAYAMAFAREGAKLSLPDVASADPVVKRV